MIRADMDGLPIKEDSGLTKDPVYVAAQFVLALQGLTCTKSFKLISREEGPLDPGVTTVGSFHAGNKHNISSDRAELPPTVRATQNFLRIISTL